MQILEAERGQSMDEILRELYIEKGLTLEEVGGELGVTKGAVSEWLARFGIQARRRGARAPRVVA